MKVLVTGASGFIGRAFCAAAALRGHDVLRLVRRLHSPDAGALQTLVGTLDDAPWPAIQDFGADAVLHLAWITTPGVYLTAPENQSLLEQSQGFLRGCLDAGIPHLAAAGSCVEYAPSEAPMTEMGTALEAGYPYSEAKLALYHWLMEQVAAPEDTWTWFRIFYPYGPGEHPQRLTSYLIRQLMDGRPVMLHNPNGVKDYIFINDLVDAMWVSLEHGLRGPVNLGGGAGIRIRDLALRIAAALAVDASLVGEDELPRPDPWPVQVADMSRLAALGWQPRTHMDEGLKRLVASLGELPMLASGATHGG